MRLLFIGDVVGSLGRKAVTKYIPQLKQEYHPQLTILNGENAASGRGITEKIYKKFLQDGVDVVTLGNHAWDHREIYEFIDTAPKLLRPSNFPNHAPGQGSTIVTINQFKVGVINIQARTFMNQMIDDPFPCLDQLITEISQKTPIIFVDIHGETTSEKMAVAWYLDGRVSAVIGTHTHVQTNDARILAQGTAFLTDVGMTGAYDSILGMKKEAVIERFLTARPQRFEVVEQGPVILSYCVIDIDDKTGKAVRIHADTIIEDYGF